MSSSFHGVVYQTSDVDYTPVPLNAVTVQISAIDTSALVSFEQTFSPVLSPSPLLAQSYYVFPLPPRSAVCKFKMCSAGGRSVTAVIELDQDLAQQSDAKIPFPMENAFVISLGKTDVAQPLKVLLSYVSELSSQNDDGVEETQIGLPAYVGSPCASSEDSALPSSHSASPRVHIVARIQTAGTSVKVSSKTHTADIVLLPSSNDGRATIGFTSATFLEKDFVLIIQTSTPNDASRCFAERRTDDTNHVAMHLTFIPNFLATANRSQEYIFVIDRSLSMRGRRIQQAKDALVILLHALPHENTNFNVYGFGGTCYSVFSSTVPCSDQTLQSAEHEVENMEANIPGTSMYGALSDVLRSRNVHISTSVFLLTDGEPTDGTPDEIIDLVADAISQSSSSSPLRVFTLGIRCSSSKTIETCEGIARAGRGECSMISDASGIMGQFGKLFRIGRTYVLRNVSIDWGLPLDADVDAGAIQQIPKRVPDLYPGQTLIASALLKHYDFVIPDHVIVRGQKDGEGDFLEAKVPVIEVKWSDWSQFPLLHTTIARRLIAGKQGSMQTQESVSLSRRQSVIQLSRQHQLVTLFTRFVPVVESEKPPSPSPPLKKSRHDGEPRHNLRLPLLNSRRRESRIRPPTDAGPNTSLSLLRTSLNYVLSSTRNSRHIPNSPTVPVAMRSFTTKGSISSSVNATPFPTTSPVIAPTDQDTTAAVSSNVQRQSLGILSFPGGTAAIDTSAVNDATTSMLISHHPLQTNAPDATAVDMAPSSPIDTDTQRLIRLCSADGSWGLSPEFTKIVGEHPFDYSIHSISNDRLWWTALAITYLKTHLKNQPDYLQLFVPKSMEFGSQAAAISGDNFGDILRLADAAINGSATESSVLEIVEAEDEKAESLEGPNLPVERPSLKPSRRWALTRTCTFISLVIPFVILLLTTFSTSVLPNVALFVVLGSNSQLRFGIWGVCVDDLSSIPLTRGACSVPQVFYSVSPQFFDAVGHPELSGIIPHRLMKVLILHPIATSLSYCVIFAPFIFHKSRRMAIIFLSLVLLTATISSVSLAVDVAVAIVARDRVCAVHSEGVRVEVGITTWMMLAVVMLYLWSATLLTLMFLKAYRTRY